MITKLFEVRDSGTFIPVMATRFKGNESPLFRAAGYGPDQFYVIVCKLTGGECAATYDPFGWPKDARTMNQAHLYIEKNFDLLSSGDVIDVEFIMGLTTLKKRSQL